MSAVNRRNLLAMKHRDDELPTFHALLSLTRPEDWKMSRRTYYRWLSGELAEAIDILIANPKLLAALYRDVTRNQREKLSKRDHG